ncbi:hypothetical protein E2C01_078379 [Portunus trituberculatus]|uniref:Uncharacterized protein n=1 Tax=Portunus trituberculatus TaxID=210409 RepID=A0A5B7ITZ9_PORTR|nr:hypothetical protein [Portunus trituberculatus]
MDAPTRRPINGQKLHNATTPLVETPCLMLSNLADYPSEAMMQALKQTRRQRQKYTIKSSRDSLQCYQIPTAT